MIIIIFYISTIQPQHVHTLITLIQPSIHCNSWNIDNLRRHAKSIRGLPQGQRNKLNEAEEQQRILLSWLRRRLMHRYGVWVFFFFPSNGSESSRHAILLCHSLIGIYAAPNQRGCSIAASKLEMTRFTVVHSCISLWFLLNGGLAFRNTEGLLMHSIMGPKK